MESRMYLLLVLVLLTLADHSQGVPQMHEKSLTVSTSSNGSAVMGQPAIPKPNTNLTQHNIHCCCKGKGGKVVKSPCPCPQHRRSSKNGKWLSQCQKKKSRGKSFLGPSSPM